MTTSEYTPSAMPSSSPSSPPRQSTRSPTAPSTTTTTTTNSSITPVKSQHSSSLHHSHHSHHHHHLPVGHTTHSPAQSATGEAIQGKPSEAGGLHSSTSRGNILVPPSSTASSIASTPADLLSVVSGSSSRPGSPSAPGSPVFGRLASRPTSPSRSPNISMSRQQHNDIIDTMSNSTPQLDSSAVFERDVEFATDHLLTGSEAIDLAAAPVLSEVALAVTSNEPSPELTSSTGNIALLGGGGGGTTSPFQHNNITQSLDSTLFSSSSPQLPSNAIISDGQDPTAIASTTSPYSIPLSERLRSSSNTASGGGAANISDGTAMTTTNTGDFSPPPSLSLSPSATGSPISSAGPGSPVQALHYPSNASNANMTNTNVFGSSAPFGHSLSDGGVPVQGLEVGDGNGLAGLPSPPGSAMSGISLSGTGKDGSKRRLSMISYADIINSERLSDTHSGFTSPTPSSALSLSAAALPVQGNNSNHGTPSLSPGLGGGLDRSGILGGGGAAIGGGTATTGGGLGSALYSPVTSPEGDGALSPSVNTDTAAARGYGATSTDEGSSFPLSKPSNNRTETMSSTTTERFYMPGQLPLQTPPISHAHSSEKDDKDVTPTNSKIKTEVGEQGEEPSNLKGSTSGPSWSMMEMGKALVGNAAGAVGSVLGVSGIGTEVDDKEDEEDKVKGH